VVRPSGSGTPAEGVRSPQVKLNSRFVLYSFWYLTLGNKTNEKEALVSLGVADESGRPAVFPREMGSEFVVQKLQQA
jgi:hypothetical protein